ncbi:MAG: DUF4186 domain-containing protein [Planctomycetes bacterium]|nr:DUF4186 domain-containing protein [Planctomycetota bacterium]
MKAANETGACRTCGAKLVDWGRVHSMKVADVEYTFDALKHELIRHHFWHVEIDPKAVNYARRKGTIGLQSAVRSRIHKAVGIANNPYDGRQTPMEGSGNPIHYAQHATATCCRKCMEYWYGIQQKCALNADEIEYFTELVMLYIKDRLPDLSEEGEHVPPLGRAT